MSLNPDQIISFELQANEWDIVFQALADVPYRHSNAIIQKLGQQLQKYQETPHTPGAKPNGSGEVLGVQR